MLAAIAHEGTAGKTGITAEQLRSWLQSQEQRSRFVERSITMLYGANVVFISNCLSIALVRALGGSLSGLPVMLAVGGTLLLLIGGRYMVAESRLSAKQISDEIQIAIQNLEGHKG